MSYSKIATEIVKKSIRAAICIDDKFAEPYDTDQNLNQNIPNKLFNSFRNNGNCSLDIYRFRDFSHWEEIGRKQLANKDLIILDWELEDHKVNYGNTLKILDEIVSHSANQFVIIYTHLPELERIADIIKSYYSEVNINTKPLKENDFTEFYEEEGDSYEDLIGYIKKTISYGEVYTKKYKLTKILQSVGYRGESGIFIKKSKDLLKLNNQGEILEFFVLIAHSLRTQTNDIKRKCFHLDSSQLVLNIDNTIVLISQKRESDAGDGVLPEDLFYTFAEAITQSPSNIMAILASELKDKFRSNIAIMGSKIPKIDESAFFCHWKNLRNEDDTKSEEADKQFKQFLLETWLNDVSLFTIQTSNDIASFDVLLKYADEKELFDADFENIDPDLMIKLAANYSNVQIPPNLRTDQKIQFGDMFYLTSLKEKSFKEVLLSITPHCDSIRPKKINNTLYFVRGLLLKSKGAKIDALKAAETSYFSFVNDNGLLYGIEWITRPISVYIDFTNNNVSSLMDVSFYNNDYRMEYITTLKENYTQRIANHSFGQAMRVGVSQPKLK